MIKQIIRQQIIKKRNSLSDSQKIIYSKDLFISFLRFLDSGDCFESKNISLYIPFRNEIDPKLIIEYLWDINIPLLLPSIKDNSKFLKFFRYTKSDNLVEGKFGILESSNREQGSPDIILAPVVVFNSLGHRIGYGGGYYDATVGEYLRKKRRYLYIGLAYDFQEVDNIKISNHDIKLDGIITNSYYKYFDTKNL